MNIPIQTFQFATAMSSSPLKFIGKPKNGNNHLDTSTEHLRSMNDETFELKNEFSKKKIVKLNTAFWEFGLAESSALRGP